jgi:hypothetical protein
MARKATFTPTGARNVGPGMRVTPGGETFKQAQARQAGGKVSKAQFFPNEKVTPEKSYGSQVLQDLHTAQVFDTYADGTRTTPFELGLDRQGMTDYVTIGDDYDANNMEYNPDTGPATWTGTAPVDETPAPISIAPTSTINPDRPRTVAAGYTLNPGSQSDGKLTVIFRDGTFYNYYDVAVTTWQAFKAAPSKGRFIRTFLDSHTRGIANAGSVPQKQSIHKAARVAQKTLHKQRPRASGKRTVQVPRQTRRRRVS